MNCFGPLACYRTLYCAWLGAAVLLQWREHLRWVCTRGEARQLPRLLDAVPMPRLHRGGFALIGLVMLAGLAWAATRTGAGWALLAASAASLLYFAQVIELPAVRRKPNTVPVILALLGLAGLSGAKDAALVAWLVVVSVKVLVAQIYLSSALVKLRCSGWRWLEGNTLRVTLLRYHLRDDNRWALWLARRSWICRVLSTLVLGFELTFWLVIPFPALAWIYVPAGLVFHLGTAVLMRIHYWIYVVPAYFVFVVPR